MDLNIFIIQFQTGKLQNIAKTLEITAFLPNELWQNMPLLVPFSPTFVRWAGVGGMPSTPPMAKATGEWPSAQHGPAGFKG